MNRVTQAESGSMGRIFGGIPLCFFFLTLLVSLAFAATTDPRQEIRRLLEEAPSLSSYPAKTAVVLSRSVANRLLADGSMERRNRWIILFSGSLPRRWQTWRLPAPEGGSARFLRAEIYSVLGMKITARLDTSTSSKGGAVLEIPDSPGDSVLYLEAIQTFPRRFTLDDLVRVALDLPQWELQVEVSVPQGSRLNWAGSGIGQPERFPEKGIERFSWSAKNLPPVSMMPLLDRGNTTLGFSLKSGLVPSLRDVGELEKAFSRLPKGLSSRLSGKNPEKDGMQLLADLTAEKNRDEGLPAEWVRLSAGDFPEDGPWSEWERTLLAACGLKALGWSVRTWWLPATPVLAEPPAGAALWAGPVLEVSSSKGGQPFFFTAKADTVSGKTPSFLYGATLYRLDGETVLKTKIPEGSAAGNRLSVKWQLQLDEAGFAKGKLLIQLKGGWDSVLQNSEGSLTQKAIGLVRDMLSGTPFASGMGEPKVSQAGNGIEILVPVNGLLGIASQKDLLVRFPAQNVPGIREVLEETERIKLKFPFSVKQEFFLDLPKGFRVLEPPSLRGKSTGKTSVEETFRNNEKKGRVEAEQLVTISASGFDGHETQSVKDSLAQVLRWATNSIPLRRR